MIKIDQLILDLDTPQEQLGAQISDLLGVPLEGLSWRIIRESLDARRRQAPRFIYQVAVDLDWDEKRVRRLKKKNVHWQPAATPTALVPGDKRLANRPVVIGAGPAGLFCAYELARLGYAPLLLEQGASVPERVEDVARFLSTGVLLAHSNVQFGEGGAGTFSDGKLTSRSKNPLGQRVLEILAEQGAPADICYAQRPHIGTDLLRDVMVRLRDRIRSLGGDVRFHSEVVDFRLRQGAVAGVVLADGTSIPAEAVVMAPGHSARTLFRRLAERSVAMESKAFAVGFRIEHPQGLINEVQHREWAGHPRLGAADYQLTAKDELSGRGVYTFCMCPGGEVIGASSSAGHLVVNGMSEHARAGVNANSAVLAGVTPSDFGKDVLAGVLFQERIEAEAFALGGGDFTAPVQRLGDFLQARPSKTAGSVQPTVRPGHCWSDLTALYPSSVCGALVRGIVQMERRLQGFAMADAVLTGVETRSSSPVRILRHADHFESINMPGLFPAGEGAGYAGGIVSSAIDGMRVAHELVSRYQPWS